MTTNEAPFRSASSELVTNRQTTLTLQPITAAEAPLLAWRIAAIDPWLTLGISAERLTRALLDPDLHICMRALRCEDVGLTGVVGVRHPWLYGPYLSMLAIFPEHHGHGHGAAVLDWLAREAEGVSRNVWVCASTFNQRAIGFYRRHGFEPVGEIPELVADGFSELLMRKRLSRPGAQASEL